MKGLLCFFGSAVYGLVASYLIWLMFHFFIPWFMSFGWIALIIYVMFLGSSLIITGGLSSIVAMPIYLMSNGRNYCKWIPIICFVFFGFSACRLPWGLDIEYTLVKYIIGGALSITVVLIYISIIVALFMNSNVKWNPIDSICYDGTLGFVIGDSRDFVISRARHLKIMTDDEFGKINGVFSSLYLSRIKTAVGLYENVESIVFNFIEEKLKSITIFIDSSTPDIDNTIIFSAVKNRLKMRLGKAYYESKNSFVWSNGKRTIYLSNAYIEEVQERITIVIE